MAAEADVVGGAVATPDLALALIVGAPDVEADEALADFVDADGSGFAPSVPHAVVVIAMMAPTALHTLALPMFPPGRVLP